MVVDNVEQLLPDAAGALAAVTAVAPSLRLIVTSREAVRIGAETQFDLPPLAEAESIELFLARARAVRPDLEGTLAVGELCARLDHLPLAIELAAARTKLLSPEVLLEKLGARLDLPAQRDADPRHATLRTTIDWSYELLDEREKRLFERLSVFAGGCTLESAEDVCDADLDGLASLLDKSLVRRRTDPHGVDRYWMLETIREYAAGRLAELPGHADHLRRHAERMLEIARAAHLSVEDIGRETQDFETVHAEREDVRSALDWATEHDPVLAAEIVVALDYYWTTAAWVEARPRIEVLLETAAVSPGLRARLLRLHGGIVILSGEVELGEMRYREALAIFRRLGDEFNVVGLLSRFTVHAGSRGDAQEAHRLVAETRRLNETAQNPQVESQMLSTLARLAHRQGDAESALALTRRAVRAARESNFQLWTLWELSSQLEFELELGLLDDAERTGREGLELAQRLDDPRMTRWLLTGLALAALRRGDEELAGQWWGVVVSDLEEANETQSSEFLAYSGPLVDCATARFREAFDSGRLLPLRQAGALALGESQTEP